jgi:PEP-CTERM motif-containing protein
MRLPVSIAAALTLTLGAGVASAAPIQVFYTDFNTSLAPEISPGSATLTPVQGYAGLGPVGDQFGGNFLRSATGNTVTLNLSGLPAHDTITLEFLFAAIDSLDGTGVFPAGDFFKIVFDGATLFSESFANAAPGQIQSYVPPPGVELARHVDLGFTDPGATFPASFYTDSAYNLGADPLFANFAHVGSTATIEFFIFGPGNQDLADESWAMDNLRVSVTTLQPTAVPEPASLMLVGTGLLALANRARLRRRRQ